MLSAVCAQQPWEAFQQHIDDSSRFAIEGAQLRAPDAPGERCYNIIFK